MVVGETSAGGFQESWEPAPGSGVGVGVGSGVGSGGGSVAGGRWTVKLRAAGVGSRFPAASRARTSNVWLPFARFEYSLGELHEPQELASSRQWNVERASVEVKAKLAEVISMVPAGPAVMVVSGGVLSFTRRARRATCMRLHWRASRRARRLLTRRPFDRVERRLPERPVPEHERFFFVFFVFAAVRFLAVVSRVLASAGATVSWVTSRASAVSSRTGRASGVRREGVMQLRIDAARPRPLADRVDLNERPKCVRWGAGGWAPGYHRGVEPDEVADGRPSAPTARDVGRALSWLGVGQLAGQVWWYGSLVALGALLSPRDFGTIAAGLVVVQIAQFLMDSGTRGSLIVAPAISAALLRRALAFNVGTGLLLTLGVAALAGPFVDAFASGGQADAIRFLAVAVVLSALVPVPMAILQRKLDFKRQATVLGVAATVASIAAIVAALLGAGVWALALRQVLYQAVIACLSWWSVRRMLPRRGEGSGGRQRVRQEQAFWFFLVSLSQFLALNVDYLVVGGVTDARRLGLYSLAFTIAFAPVSQFSSQIGKVVFPAAAATRDREVVANRALKATRLLALVTMPFVPPAVALAPAVLPAVFGQEWTSMVLPFQILLVAAVGQVLLSVVQESLSGTGNVAFFATTSVVWLVATTVVLLVLVRIDGIRGAALTHVILLVPLCAAYATAGARRIGLSTRRLLGGLRGILAAVAVESVVTAAAITGLEALGLEAGVAALLGAAGGLITGMLVIWRLRDGPLLEARAAIAALRHSPA